MEEAVLEKIEKFFSQFKHQTYKKGEILIRADDPPSGIFYLKEGLVKQYSISKKGEELVLNVFKPNSFFPMSWAINNTKNPYYFEATTQVEVYKAPGDKAVEFVQKNQDVLYDLLSRVYRGVDGMLIKMESLLSGDAYRRIISELIIQAKRFGKKQPDGIEVLISEKDLAAEIGLTRETVSREIKILKDKNLISFRSHSLIIFDLSQLEIDLSEGF